MEEEKYLTEDERKQLLKEMGKLGKVVDPEDLMCPECGGSVLVSIRPWCTKCDKLFDYNECIKKKEQ